MVTRASEPDRDDAAAVLVAVRRIVRYLRLADREVENACGLTAAQLFVLNQLAATPGMSLGEVAERSLTDQSSVSTVVARLVEQGYVTRKPAPTDGRRAMLDLTAKGARTISTAPRPPQDSIVAAVRAMTPARRMELVRSLEGLAAAIGANEHAPRMLFEDEPPRKVSRKKPRR